MKHPSGRNCRGLTIINLLSSIVIIAILVGFVIPGFSNVIDANRKREAVSQLMAMLNYARDTAVHGSTSVIICPTNATGSCASDWNETLMVFIDANNNFEFDNDDRKVQTFKFIDEKQSLNWRSFGSKHYLSYDDQGTTGYQSGRIYYCDENANEPHDKAQIIIYRTGRARIASRSEYKSGC